jgi:hypothetical protein
MKSGNYILPIYKLSQIDPDAVPRKISYSQWAMFEQCPKQWELTYIKKLSAFRDSIETVFGTAFHETLQQYLTTLYTESVKSADSLQLDLIIRDNIRKEYQQAVENNGGEHFSTPTELSEYLADGVAILSWIKKRRSQYFTTKNHELVAIELELCTPASVVNPNVYWGGFIDVVIRDTVDNIIKIIDIKTSRTGWNAHQKANKIKAAQLVAYKNYFSQQFGVPKDNIDVEFFIVKRKIVEESMFPQKRVQVFAPASGKVTQKQIQRQVDSFIEQCFDADGERDATREYVATAGKGAKNCKWCPFKTDYEACPKESRLRS